MSTSFDRLPPDLAWLRTGTAMPVTVGQSGASVWRISTDAETLFLKGEPLLPSRDLAAEAERLGWLRKTGIPAPAVRTYCEGDADAWLLMTALTGADLTQMPGAPADVAKLMGRALRDLHDLDPSDCPFDARLPKRLHEARLRIAAGLVDETDFDESRHSWTAADVLEFLEAHPIPSEDLVITHGDATLSNFMAEGGRFTGLLDVGRLGVADRWQDLAIACRSMIGLGDTACVEPFLSAYGAPWNLERYIYYCALDELF